MKTMIRLIAVVGAAAILTVCTACQNNTDDLTPTQAPAVITASPTEAATQAPEPSDAPATAPAVTEPSASVAATDSSAADKAELVDSKWTLTEVYVNGEKYKGNYYGSIIKQTGAYIEFREDDTFRCILGFPGCEGTYTVDNGIITLHITTKYSGSSGEGEPCDETETLIWDRTENTIKFNFNDVTNVFVKV